MKQKKYQIIYTDPPWSFGGGGVYQDNGRAVRRTADQYRLTKTKDLMQLRINDITDDDALCFMWTTDQHIPDAIKLMEAWGFRYCTVAFYWVKKYGTGSTCFNVGCWTMKSVEQCLLGLKGKPMKFKLARNIKQLVEAVRVKHSQKPEEIADRIVALVGDRPRIELFARTKRNGWDVWGDEVESDIEFSIK